MSDFASQNSPSAAAQPAQSAEDKRAELRRARTPPVSGARQDRHRGHQADDQSARLGGAVHMASVNKVILVMREATEWHRLMFNGRLAEIAAQYLRKGAQIYVEGQIRTRKFNDKEGVQKSATKIRVDQL